MDEAAPATQPADNANRQMLVQLLDHLADLHRTALAGTYLTFHAGGEACALRVLQLASVALFPKLHPLPGAPKYVLGMVSLDKRNIPVIDLRLKMQMRLPASPEQGLKHLVIAYVQRLDGELQPVGLVVDRLDKLVEYASEEITLELQPPVQISADFVLGQTVKNGQSVTLLALDHIIPPALVNQLMEKLMPTNPKTTIFWPDETMSSFGCN